MSDDDLDRDPVVAGALQTMRAPEHGPGFWAELDRRLAEVPAPSRPPDDAGEAEVLPVHPSMADRAERRPRPDRMGRLAAAAVVVVLLGVLAIVATRPAGDREVTADGTASTATPPPTTTPETPTTATPTPSTTTGDRPARPGPPRPPTPEAAVDQWLGALGGGNLETAAALTGPRSRAYVEALGGNLDGMLIEMAEGYGAWMTSTDRSMTEVAIGELGGAQMAVVVISGTRTAEGETEERVDAIPVIRDDGRWMVEPVAFDPSTGGPIELVEPPRLSAAAASGMPPDGIIEATAPGDGRFFFSLDGGGVVSTGSSGVWDPPGDMSSQTHLLVVTYVDGPTVTALATTFLVEG